MRHNFTRFAGLAAVLLAVSPLAMGQSTTTQAVRFHTNLGDIDVALLNTSAPNTVANFLMYVNQGSYNNSVIHRSVPGFIFQGGGYQLQNGSLVAIPQGSPVVNEFGVSNTRGTLAMAKLGSDPNSATNQWFFNEGNNSANLDNQNGGFTVFGRITSAAGLAVMDQIAAVPVPSPGPLPSPFDQIPLINYDSGTVQPANFVTVLSVTQLADIGAPTISDNGVVTATNFGGYASAAPGSYIEIYGSNLGGDARGWASTDFVNGNAPTSLGGVTVTVNGRAAYVNYVSPTQINVEIPGVTPVGGSVPVVVTYLGQTSASFMLPIQQNAAGLLAPPSFNINGKQYAGVLHAATGALVGNGSVPGVPNAPAVPGETLTFYGIGFGAVTPNSIPIAGQVVRIPTTLTTPVQFNFGSVPATVTYAGLVQGLVGVYQFNVTVPPGLPAGDVPLQVVLGGQVLPQTLYVPVQSAQ